MPLRDLEPRGPLEAVVSRYTGVVRGVEEVLGAPDDIRCPNYVAEAPGAPAGGAFTGRHLGGGSAPSHRRAREAAIGEAVERYSACCTTDAAAVIATARELGDAAVRPGRFALYHERQHAAPRFPYARFDEDTRVAWVQGLELPDGGPVWLPAQLVYLAWERDEREASIGRTTSNGLAAHVSVAEATLTGLLELLERDAFMITWRARLELPQLEWRPGDALAQFVARYVEPTGLRCTAVDLSAFWHVPCVLGVARSDAPEEAPLGVGAAAAPTVQDAVAKAFDEACRVRSWARSLRHRSFVPPRAEEIADFEQHVAYYADAENACRADFLDGSTVRRSVDDVAALEGSEAVERIVALCARLEQRGTGAYVVDVTAPDVAEAGLRVVRVLAPELCPLDVEHHAPLLGGRRLYDAPSAVGLRAGPLRFDDLNRDPHPFP